MLARLRAAHEAEKDALRSVYEQQQEWARHFNHLIWLSFEILAPVAFLGLCLFDQASRYGFLAVAVGSIVLMHFWHVFAEGHRRLWEERFEIADRIEIVWGIRHPCSVGQPLAGPRREPLRVREARHRLVRVAYVVWSIAVIAKFLIPELGEGSHGSG